MHKHNWLRENTGLSLVIFVDMFGFGKHVEAVISVSQLKPDSYIDVELELDELDITAAELAATYQEINDYIMERHGVRVNTTHIAQVKRKYGIKMGKGRPSKPDGHATRPCTAEREMYIKEALEHFAMIQSQSG